MTSRRPGSYLPEAGDWQKTALLLTGPLIIASVVTSYLVGLLGSGSSLFGQFRPTIVSSLLSIVTAAVAAGVMAFIFSRLAAVFDGKGTFAFGLAATSLAFVLVYLGQALAWLPWVGGLLSLGLLIYVLVLLWRIVPIYLEVPDSARVAHYVVSLLASFLVIFILGSIVGQLLYGSATGGTLRGLTAPESSGSDAPAGTFGGVIRRAELLAMAEEDRYTPPANGRVSDEQVREFLRVMERTREMRQQQAERLQDIAERAERNEKVSIGKLGELVALHVKPDKMPELKRETFTA